MLITGVVSADPRVETKQRWPVPTGKLQAGGQMGGQMKRIEKIISITHRKVGEFDEKAPQPSKTSLNRPPSN
jgi:hypothetical protein